jgi:hypothetical protein
MTFDRGIGSVSAILFGVFAAASAPALTSLTPNWSNATPDASSTSKFDTGTLLFSGQSAAQITIVNPGTSYYHDHGIVASATVEVLRSRVWTQVYTAPVSNGDDIPLSSLPVPLANFQAGTISGVRLSCTSLIGNCYHSIEGTMQFLLTGGAPTSVPTLSECTMLALMLGVALAITDGPTVRDILVHLGEPTTPPPVAPARGPPRWNLPPPRQSEIDPHAQPAPDDEFDQRVAW